MKLKTIQNFRAAFRIKAPNISGRSILFERNILKIFHHLAINTPSHHTISSLIKASPSLCKDSGILWSTQTKLRSLYSTSIQYIAQTSILNLLRIAQFSITICSSIFASLISTITSILMTTRRCAQLMNMRDMW